MPKTRDETLRDIFLQHQAETDGKPVELTEVIAWAVRTGRITFDDKPTVQEFVEVLRMPTVPNKAGELCRDCFDAEVTTTDRTGKKRVKRLWAHAASVPFDFIQEHFRQRENAILRRMVAL